MQAETPSQYSERCAYYAQFTHHLDRVTFDGLFWSSFFAVILILFIASSLYQGLMRYRGDPQHDKAVLRRKVKMSLAWTLILFILAGVLVVIEVFCLLALQFCDGEDLMSLYWSTWTMLQLGAEIAILGILLALYHLLVEVEHPSWALALGTPVLVTAGFGHAILVSLLIYWRRKTNKNRDPESDGETSERARSTEDTEKIRSHSTGSAGSNATLVVADEKLPIGERFLFELQLIGNGKAEPDEMANFVSMENGKATFKATIRRVVDLEAQNAAGPAS
ncbi:hypothetical protein BX600DRAFT_534798 [Xylariales sp. PMI_506]|nr:hypothetical protein BX600DRAFT_534798 [Xylariales sp. PMI_506]